MNVTGIVEIKDIRFIPKDENGKKVLDYTAVKGLTYSSDAEEGIKKDKNGKEIVSEFILKFYGKFAIHLQKLAKTENHDLTGYKIWIKKAKLHDKIEKIEAEEGTIEKRTGKYIKVFKAELLGKKIKNPELSISFNGFILSSKKGDAIEEKIIDNKLIKASFRIGHYHYVSKDVSEALFANIDSIDSFKDETDKYKNKTGILIKNFAAKSPINILGTLRQSFFEDKNGETQDWTSINLDDFNFISGGKTTQSENHASPSDFDDEEDSDFDV